MSTAKTMPLIQRGARLQRRFYIGVTLLMGIFVVTGFWATYFGPLVRGTIAQPLLIHVHATVFVGWLALFLAQSTLAATGHVDWHLKLGRAGIGYGFLLIAVGLFTTVMRSAEQMRVLRHGAIHDFFWRRRRLAAQAGAAPAADANSRERSCSLPPWAAFHFFA